jgi:hypothetical protein
MLQGNREFGLVTEFEGGFLLFALLYYSWHCVVETCPSAAGAMVPGSVHFRLLLFEIKASKARPGSHYSALKRPRVICKCVSLERRFLSLFTRKAIYALLGLP